MAVPTKQRSVLLVDDCNAHRLLTERALRRAQPGTRCVSLSDGDAAIRHLGECCDSGSRPELLLLDWRMPGLSGADVLAWIRAQPALQGLSVLVVSGCGFPEDRQLAARLGADGYLLKPENPAGYQVLAKQVGDWRQRISPVTRNASGTKPRPRVPAASVRPWRGTRLLRHVYDVLASLAGASVIAPTGEPAYVDSPADQLTLDLVRLCRAQGILPRDILQVLPPTAAGSAIASQRRTIIRGLAKRGWDSYELAEVFPLPPAAIRTLVRRRLDAVGA